MKSEELKVNINYYGTESLIRKIIIGENLDTIERVAVMTLLDVCEKLLNTYDVLSCNYNEIRIVKRKDIITYNL